MVRLFAGMEFSVCNTEERETGYDKVAVYAQDGEWTHAARQLESGMWTSKLGFDEDIAHPSPSDLAGEIYGEVHCIMRRQST